MAEQRGSGRGPNDRKRKPGQSRGKGASSRSPKPGGGRGGTDRRPRRDGERNERGQRGRDGGAGERRSGARGLRGDGREAPPEAGPKSWGGLARRGAARLHEDESLHEAELEPEYEPPTEEEDPEAYAKHQARVAKRAAGEANRDRLRDEAKAAIDRSGRTPKPKGETGRPGARERAPLKPRKLPDPKRQLKDLLGDSGGGRAWRDLNVAADHIDQGRATEARTIAHRLYKRAGEVVEVAEIYGLALYGLSRWHEAIDVLEDVRASSGLADQNPVLADAHRAVGNYADVEALWAELREASPSAELMTEGRIVAAGSLADQGKLQDAVRLLNKGWKRPKRPFDHHLRRAYALADLLERAGEGSQGKELFSWIAHHQPAYLDARARGS